MYSATTKQGKNRKNKLQEDLMNQWELMDERTIQSMIRCKHRMIKQGKRKENRMKFQVIS